MQDDRSRFTTLMSLSAGWKMANHSDPYGMLICRAKERASLGGPSRAELRVIGMRKHAEKEFRVITG